MPDEENVLHIEGAFPMTVTSRAPGKWPATEGFMPSDETLAAAAKVAAAQRAAWPAGHLPMPEWVLINAVRYALGRQTYVVGDTARLVERHWPDLGRDARILIYRDVARFMEGINPLDDDKWHVAPWKVLHTLLRQSSFTPPEAFSRPGTATTGVVRGESGAPEGQP